MKRETAFTARLLLTMALLTAGCSDDAVSPDPDSGYAFASTVSKLLANVELAHQEMNADEFVDLLDDRYRFYYVDGAEHTQTVEATMTRNMFSGEPATNALPWWHDLAIDSIEVRTFDLLEPWEAISANHEDFGAIEGAMRGFYDVELSFFHETGSLTVQGHCFFYAVPTQVDVGGQIRTEWKLLGHEEIVSKAGNEDLYWGTIKNMFR